METKPTWLAACFTDLPVLTTTWVDDTLRRLPDGWATAGTPAVRQRRAAAAALVAVLASRLRKGEASAHLLHIAPDELRQAPLQLLPAVRLLPHGKPQPVSGGFAFNLSHCPTAVAAAVTQGADVGIDVESRRRVSPALVRRVCSSAEQEQLRQAADAELAFVRLWTRKEAVAKLSGEGLQLSLPPLLESLPPSTELHTFPLPNADGFVSIASLSSDGSRTGSCPLPS